MQVFLIFAHFTEHFFNNDQQVSVETEVKGQVVRNGRSAKINFLGTQGIYIFLNR